jgi:hypothetical protein
LLGETPKREIVIFQDLQLDGWGRTSSYIPTHNDMPITTMNSRTTTSNSRTAQEDETEADEFVFHLNSDEAVVASLDYDIQCTVFPSNPMDSDAAPPVLPKQVLMAAAMLHVARSRKRWADEGETQGGSTSKRSRR